MNQDDVDQIKFHPRLALDRMLRARGTPPDEPEAPADWGYPSQEPLTAQELQALAEEDDIEARLRAAHHADCPETLRRDIALQVLSELSTEEGEAWEEIYELAFYFLEDVLRLDADPEFLRAAHRLLDDFGYGSLRTEIARNPACPDDVYLALLDDEEVCTDDFPFNAVWHNTLVNVRKPPEAARSKLKERLLEAAQWDSDEIRRLAARSPYADAEVLLLLLTADQPYDGTSDATILAVRQHPNLPNQVVALAAALTEGPPEWRRLLAFGLDPEDEWAFELMAQDKDDSVRAAIAGHDEAPRTTLEKLAIDESIQVRRAVWSNRASTEAMRASAAVLGV